MPSRKLTCEVMHETIKGRDNSPEYTLVTLKFSRKLTPLELSGINGIMNGTIK